MDYLLLAAVLPYLRGSCLCCAQVDDLRAILPAETMQNMATCAEQRAATQRRLISQWVRCAAHALACCRIAQAAVSCCKRIVLYSFARATEQSLVSCRKKDSHCTRLLEPWLLAPCPMHVLMVRVPPQRIRSGGHSVRG